MDVHSKFLRVVKPVSVVNGINFPLYIKQEDVNEIVQTFQLKPSDIWISTFAKAGTTWTQQIVKLIRNRGVGDAIKINESIPWLEANGHFKVDLSLLPQPRAFKSHMPYDAMIFGKPHECPGKYIYVVRNPKDVAVSLYFHYHKLQLKPGADLEWPIFFDNFIGGKTVFGDFFDHVLSWWCHKDNKNVLILFYEDMKKDLTAAISRIAQFIEIDISDEKIAIIAAMTTFDSMKNDNTANYSWDFLPQVNPELTPFMRKGEVGDWKNYFTREQSIQIDKICTERLRNTGLVFEFEPH